MPPSTIEAVAANNFPGSSLPNLEDVFLLNQPTLCFIPSKSQPAFARALSSTLRSVIRENSEEAWLKLFMLPKCVLPSSRRRGLHDRPLQIDTLCKMWTENDFTSLWNLAKSCVASQNEGKSGSSSNQHTNQAVSLGRSGMMGKACRVLQSNGIAPNNETTWELLKAKHPRGPVPLLPATHSAPVTLEQVLSILHSFPKDMAAGPSGLRVQHLLDVASIPLPTPHKEQQPWLLRLGSMQPMMIDAKHSDGHAFLLPWKRLEIGEERHNVFFLAWLLCWL